MHRMQAKPPRLKQPALTSNERLWVNCSSHNKVQSMRSVCTLLLLREKTGSPRCNKPTLRCALLLNVRVLLCQVLYMSKERAPDLRAGIHRARCGRMKNGLRQAEKQTLTLQLHLHLCYTAYMSYVRGHKRKCAMQCNSAHGVVTRLMPVEPSLTSGSMRCWSWGGTWAVCGGDSWITRPEIPVF